MSITSNKRMIEPLCDYCRHGTPLGQGEIACIKRGVVLAGEQCARFSYDAIKRAPEVRAKPKASAFTSADFEL